MSLQLRCVSTPGSTPATNLNSVVLSSNPCYVLDYNLQNDSGKLPLSGMYPSELNPELMLSPLLGSKTGHWENEIMTVETLGLLSDVELPREMDARENVINVCTPPVCANVSAKTATHVATLSPLLASQLQASNPHFFPTLAQLSNETRSSKSHLPSLSVRPSLVLPKIVSSNDKPCTIEPSIVQSAIRSWSSLFQKLSCNAGDYLPVDFDMVEIDGALVPPPEVMQVGNYYWSESLVGFFLDSNSWFYDARNLCRSIWKLRGDLKVHYNNSLYYLKFSIKEERQRVLEAEPSFIDEKPFIITTWTPSMKKVREQVLSIPAWAHFSHTLSVLQPIIRLNWLACAVGMLKCFDHNTVARETLVYANALIEITPEKPLPSSIKVQIAEGHMAVVHVRYGWTPDICSSCRSFGHTVDSCKYACSADGEALIPLPAKVPLPRPPVCKWVPKKIHVVPLETVDVDIPPPSVPFIPALVVPPLVITTILTLHVIPSIPIDQPSLSVLIVHNMVLIPDLVYWLPEEKMWCPEQSDMRYSPKEDSYYIYVTDVDEKTRKLYYRIVGNSLLLVVDGASGAWNNQILADDAWDRSFIYDESTADFDHDLALVFTYFIHVIEDETSVDDCTSTVEV